MNDHNVKLQSCARYIQSLTRPEEAQFARELFNALHFHEEPIPEPVGLSHEKEMEITIAICNSLEKAGEEQKE